VFLKQPRIRRITHSPNVVLPNVVDNVGHFTEFLAERRWRINSIFATPAF